MKVSWESGAVALTLVIPLASCSPATSKRNIVQEVAAGKRWMSGPIAYNNVFTKLGQRAPEPIRRAAERAEAALAHNEKVKRGLKMNVQVVPGFEDTEYLVPVTVGNKQMRVEIDTGAVQNWVFSTLLAREDRGSHVLYNPGSKKPLVEYTSFFHSENDGRGYTWGKPYAEKVTLGSFTAQNAHVGAADTMAPRLVPLQSDGSIGMALDWPYCEGYCNSFLRSSPFNGSSYLQKFAVDLRNNGPSTWEFGSWDEASYPFAKQSWADVVMSRSGNPFINDEGKWMLGTNYCLINGKRDAKTKCNHEVIVSTSTPMIILPWQIVDYYYSKVKGAKYDEDTFSWCFPCSSTLPSFGFAFDPVNHPEGNSTPGRYLNLGPLNDGTGRCFGAIQRIITGEYNVLGTSFLKSQYVAFEAYLESGVPGGGAVMFAPKSLSKKS